MRIGSVGGVVDDADIKWRWVEVDDGFFGGGLIVGSLGNGGEVGTGFHFDNGEVVFGVFGDESLVLKKSAED